MVIRENVPISELTTMRLGGQARYVIEIERLDDISKAYSFACEKNLPTWIMGGGANTIGHDEGFDGVIILNRLKGIKIVSQNNQEIIIEAMAGEVWDDLVAFACERGYSGIEALSLIPGTVGAAPVQNIGAYGQDIAQTIEQVTAFDTLTNEFVTIARSEMQLGYRQTRFNTGADKGRFLIVAVVLRLKKENLKPPFYHSLQKYLDENQIVGYSPLNIRQAVCAVRNEKLPDPEKEASAGSFFKNTYISAEEIPTAEARGIPVRIEADGRGKINSGWLIEQAELKGQELFGFRVSNTAALVLINKSAKSYADLAKARQKIIDAVFDKFGYRLEQEPVEIPIS